MPFNRRNVVVGGPISSIRAPAPSDAQISPGVRPSPVDGRPTISTGTFSLDQIIAGAHAALPLGTSVLVEECGTTDFASVILRYYAAEGLVQGHHVHVLGLGDTWKAELPGKVRNGEHAQKSGQQPQHSRKMKIAWRYETLSMDSLSITDTNMTGPHTQASPESGRFCHVFDMASRLDEESIRGYMHGYEWPRSPVPPDNDPFGYFISNLTAYIDSSPPASIHRVVVPNLLGPEVYGHADCCPQNVLRFLCSLRGLVHKHPRKVSAFVTLSTSLHPRSSGLVRWAEILSDGVLELDPLAGAAPDFCEPGSAKATFQGLLRFYKVAFYHERGCSSKTSLDPFGFRLGNSDGLVIMPYSLPPVGDGQDDGAAPKAMGKLDF